ncbi:hypothetical protein KJA15_02720 [Patescibacteria group bacterium]|nr:hypothetical protein [Patescibacteria group bacterium]
MSSSQRKRRSKLRIRFDILIVCKRPTRKTHIMHNANLPFDLLNSYLDFLKERGLIVEKKEHWKTTRKGLKFIEAFEQIQNLLK